MRCARCWTTRRMRASRCWRGWRVPGTTLLVAQSEAGVLGVAVLVTRIVPLSGGAHAQGGRGRQPRGARRPARPAHRPSPAGGRRRMGAPAPRRAGRGRGRRGRRPALLPELRIHHRQTIGWCSRRDRQAGPCAHGNARRLRRAGRPVRRTRRVSPPGAAGLLPAFRRAGAHAPADRAMAVRRRVRPCWWRSAART